MRHFLKFIPAEKRSDAEKQYSGDNEHAQSARVTEKTPSRSKPVRPVTSSQRAQYRENSLDEIHRPSFRPAQQPRAVQPKPVQPDKPQPEKPQPHLAADAAGIRQRLESAAATESTGAFLSSLDNSAIALADSGMFNVDVDDKDDADEAIDAGFNPYNRG